MLETAPIRIEAIKSSKEVTVTILLFITIMTSLIIIGAVGSPAVTKTYIDSLAKCTTPIENTNNITDCYYEKPNQYFFKTFSKISRLNQFMYYNLQPLSAFEITRNMELDIKLSSENSTILKKSLNFTISCKDNYCEDQLLFYLPYASHKNYELIAHFYNDIPSEYINLELGILNPDYTTYVIAVKYTFFAVSTLTFALFIYKVCKVYYDSKMKIRPCIKQCIFLSISLFIYNEPLLYPTVFNLNPAWSGFSAFSNLQFVACFTFYTLQHLKNSKSLALNSKPVLITEIALMCIFGLFFLSIFIYTCYKFDDSPLYNWQKKFAYSDIAVTVVSLVFLGLICLWLIINLVFLRLDLSNRETTKLRIVNFLIIIAFFVGLVVGAFQPFPGKAMIVLSYTGIFNIYVIMLQYFYTPLIPIQDRQSIEIQNIA